ncbi:MAG TPA: [Fe-Fe] hydrogenase large subunit C-terminal domain-containing protein [Spirochaetota bacterium]|nr:[Fe-Fe] hydrogenase large subunit C-terminal domain-containing protein [Spirochaetota bacterium]HPJ35532.1 [Fe-Fe] hydrogenase large subunit C-terminal domain-containing protein [Spirochaetota bacterium]
MLKKVHSELVFTVKDKCRVCYTCVRECPVKAIKIINGQAEVIADRCIGCGNCIRVCSQNAKIFLDTTGEAIDLLKGNEVKVACLAPSFPAEFTDIDDYKILVGMIKKLGFDYVIEVAFGADLIAHEYEKHLDEQDRRYKISTDCPAVVFYVKHYYPDMVPFLAPVVSPMVATVRVAKDIYGEQCKTVFIGPCIAKKAESPEVDVVLTYIELRRLFAENGISAENTGPSEFDGPQGNKAAIFPVTRGKLHSMNKSDDISEENIFVASGKENFREAIKEFKEEPITSKHLELLCCEGCIMGPGMSKRGSHFSKTARIRNYVTEKLKRLDHEKWERDFNKYIDLDLSRNFTADDRRNPLPSDDEIEKVLRKMGKFTPEDQLNCGACGYDSCIEHAMAIITGLAETEMCLPFTIDKLHKSIEELNLSNEQLASAKQSLIQSEKLATMGQLSAGIAHELNNPLGIITMYSNILLEEYQANDQVKKDLALIVEQADRCKKIVGGLLNFARKNQLNYATVNIEEFVKHSIDSIIIPDSVKVAFKSELSDSRMDIDPDQWMQVLTNIEKNAIEALPHEGGILNISLNGTDDNVIFSFDDNGTGISQDNMDKLFTPFFTTKPIGKGTGLGLALVYGIIKMHMGHVSVNSNSDPDKGPTGTSFKIQIPRRRK